MTFIGKHPFVGTVELNKIAVGKSSLNKAQLKKIPYGPILSTAAVWAVWLAAFGNFVGELFDIYVSFITHSCNLQS